MPGRDEEIKECKKERLKERLARDTLALVIAITTLYATIVFIADAYGPVFPILGASFFIFVSLTVFVYSMLWLTTSVVLTELPDPTPDFDNKMWMLYRYRQLLRLFSYLLAASLPFFSISMIVTCIYILVGQIQTIAHKWSFVETQCSVSPDCDIIAGHCPYTPIFNLAAMLNETDFGLDAEEICSSMSGFGCFLEESNPCGCGTGLKLAVTDVWTGAVAVIMFCDFSFVVFIVCLCMWYLWKKKASKLAPSPCLVYLTVAVICLLSAVASFLIADMGDSDYSPFRAVKVMTYEPTVECFGYKRASYLISHNNTNYTLGYGQCDGTFGEHSPSRLEDVRFRKTGDNSYRSEVDADNQFPIASGVLCVMGLVFLLAHQQLTFTHAQESCPQPVSNFELTERLNNQQREDVLGVHV